MAKFGNLDPTEYVAIVKNVRPDLFRKVQDKTSIFSLSLFLAMFKTHISKVSEKKSENPQMKSNHYEIKN